MNDPEVKKIQRHIVNDIYRARRGKSIWADIIAEQLLKSGRSITKASLDDKGDVVLEVINSDDFKIKE